MLCIEGVRFLCKVEGFLDRISAPVPLLSLRKQWCASC